MTTGSDSPAGLISATYGDENGRKREGSFIQVDSVWKVFGKNPEKVLDPQYADRDKSFFQTEFGNVIAIQNVSFSVDRGETFVIMGLSGSGKSTLVRCMVHLTETTAGAIIIDGEDITTMTEKELMEFRRSKIAMVFQNYGLMPNRNVLDNAALGLEIQRIGKKERYARTRDMLELVGLAGWGKAYLHQLSGGMQQRVGLARALAVNTDILLMDEPFSSLDPLTHHQMQDQLLRLQSELRKTIVFITHDANEALKLGDRIAIMQNGRVIQIGSPKDIVRQPKNEYVSGLTQDVHLETIIDAIQVDGAA